MDIGDNAFFNDWFTRYERWIQNLGFQIHFWTVENFVDIGSKLEVVIALDERIL